MSRPPDKVPALSARIRRQIVKGTLPPGTRIPTRAELARQHGVSINTAQWAVERLEVEGFVVSRGRSGTFVSARPPHLWRYGLVLAHAYQRNPRTRIDQMGFVLVQESIRLRKTGIDVVVYDSITGHTDDPGYRRLEEDVRLHRIAGLIIVVPRHFITLPVYRMCRVGGMPLVGLSARDPAPGIVWIHPDPDRLLQAGLEDLARRGRRRVAVLTQEGNPAVLEGVERQVRRCGMITHPYWVHAIPASFGFTARRVVSLLMHASDRPDAMLITDDILLAPATAGLRDAGVSHKRPLDILAHANFPHALPGVLPVRRFGYDIRQIMSASLMAIDRVRRGETVRAQSVPIVFGQPGLPAADGR